MTGASAGMTIGSMASGGTTSGGSRSQNSTPGSGGAKAACAVAMRRPSCVHAAGHEGEHPAGALGLDLDLHGALGRRREVVHGERPRGPGSGSSTAVARARSTTAAT